MCALKPPMLHRCKSYPTRNGWGLCVHTKDLCCLQSPLGRSGCRWPSLSRCSLSTGCYLGLHAYKNIVSANIYVCVCWRLYGSLCDFPRSLAVIQSKTVCVCVCVFGVCVRKYIYMCVLFVFYPVQSKESVSFWWGTKTCTRALNLNFCTCCKTHF